MNETLVIHVRYWAAARAAAGVAEEDVTVPGPVPLSDLVARVSALHPDSRLPETVRICSVLIGEQPVSSSDPATVTVHPGDVVEFLPPFAGG